MDNLGNNMDNIGIKNFNDSDNMTVSSVFDYMNSCKNNIENCDSDSEAIMWASEFRKSKDLLHNIRIKNNLEGDKRVW